MKKKLTDEEKKALIEKFRCIVCDTVGEWENVDRFKLKPVDMCMCKSCGFVSFPTRYTTEEEVKKYYRTEYRATPSAAIIFTGERKLQYHRKFLGPVLQKFKDDGKEKPVIGEIGCATGMLLNLIKHIFPEAEIHGTELTTAYRKIAKYEYGLNLVEDFDYNKKYDLIISYHVLEHQVDADKRLKEYADCLKDDGVFYLGCPVWFREFSNSATPGIEIDQYFIPDHINAWSIDQLLWIVDKAGLKPVVTNDKTYGQMMILKKKTPLDLVEKPLFSPKKTLENLEKMYNAYMALQEHKPEEAIKHWPNCPQAWTTLYELRRAAFHQDQEKLEVMINDAIAACPNSHLANGMAGDIYSRYDKYEQAIFHMKAALELCPGHPSTVVALANIYRRIARNVVDPTEKKKYLADSINLMRYLMSISTESIPTCLSWIFVDEASMPD